MQAGRSSQAPIVLFPDAYAFIDTAETQFLYRVLPGRAVPSCYSLPRHCYTPHLSGVGSHPQLEPVISWLIRLTAAASSQGCWCMSSSSI